MGFNFNTFFGYETEINKAHDLVLIYGFAVLIFGILGLSIIAIIFRKIGLTAIISYFISPLILCLGLTLLISILPTIIFCVVASDISGVQLIYSWITIFSGMLFFVVFNLSTIKKFVKEFGKLTEQQEFRNRNR
ncbi:MULTISPECIES: hypothetical protein [unclassified Flavobacterium]|jgi:hypothetical protein|uniref:hypothetical protein n=1 Tax=unclassified Flavobacterium TaxID=196869 RepID=UPI00057C7CDF|nr:MULTISPECIES: hypothetical protein [unclassified Flavobacterium]KIA97811.1 hypothetical protein OA93_12600 [Flavobacterium sp. KMS]OUL64108.1 hypothetical protein B8T70_01330 [Flavobacterium sp. AJR]